MAEGADRYLSVKESLNFAYAAYSMANYEFCEVVIYESTLLQEVLWD